MLSIAPCHQLKYNKCKELKVEAILLELFVLLLLIIFFSMGARESEYLGYHLYFTTSVLIIPCEDRNPKNRFSRTQKYFYLSINLL